jgi:hypothetical protein
MTPDMLEPICLTAELESLVAIFERRMKAAGGYMPSLATRLRLIADEMADKYPDDINGGAA